MRARLGLLLLMALVAGAAGTAKGCSIPVFRYALERWPASPYVVTVFVKGQPVGEAKAAILALQQFAERPGAQANYVLTVVDVDEKIPADVPDVWKPQQDAVLPWIVIGYPEEDAKEWPCFAGPMTAEVARTFMDSPIRRVLARRLLSGESVVWVQVDSGERAADDVAYKLLNDALAKMEKEIVLPEIDADDPRSQLRSEMPLKVRFSALRASRSDPAEAMFLRMMLASEPGVEKEKGPVQFAVFGRGRALPPLAAKGLRPDGVADYSTFLCGACSCEVKSLNPGTDLMIAADWNALVEDRTPAEPVVVPIANALLAIPPGTVAAASAVVRTDAPNQTWWIIGGAGLGIGLVAAGALVFRSRAARQH